MAYRVSQPLATTPLPGDGKKKKRVTRKKTVLTTNVKREGSKPAETTRKPKQRSSDYSGLTGGYKTAEGQVTTERTKKVRDKSGKVKKEVTRSKTKNLDTGKTSKSKEVTRYKKDGTHTQTYKYKTPKAKGKGKETMKDRRLLKEKSKRTLKDQYTRGKRGTVKTIKGNRTSLTKTKTRTGRGTVTKKRTYKRQD